MDYDATLLSFSSNTCAIFEYSENGPYYLLVAELVCKLRLSFTFRLSCRHRYAISNKEGVVN